MNGAESIAAERNRQINEEGFDEIRDEQYDAGELVQAAMCYADHGSGWTRFASRPLWPWSKCWWKPTNRRRNLVKAGALIAAEIDRLDRAKVSQR